MKILFFYLINFFENFSLFKSNEFVSVYFSKSFDENRVSDGYKWCVEAIRQSVYAPLAMEIEMKKVVILLKQGNLTDATEVC